MDAREEFPFCLLISQRSGISCVACQMTTMSDKISHYAFPEMLVTTDWVAQHGGDPDVRIVESNEDILLYSTGHVPGAVHIDWREDLNDQLVRDYLNPEEFAKLC